LHLTINQQGNIDTTVVACGSFNWYGNTYTSSGTFTRIIPNAVGCDSIKTLHLTINQPTSNIQTITACESYTWDLNGNNYTQSGQYTTILSNTVGCDSVVTLNLIINSPNSEIEVVTACDSFSWIDGNTYLQSGQYTTILSNEAGCDSVVILNLTINTPTYGMEVIAACESFTWMDGISYTASTNEPIWTLTNSVGCDSIITLNLTINETSTSTIIDTAIDVYSLNGIDYTSSGTYTQLITNENGCDSIINLYLTIYNTGIGDFLYSKMKIYPNPSNGSLQIDWDKELITALQIKLYDYNGKLIKELDTKSHHHELKNLVDGVYFIKLVTKQGVFVEKLVLN
jgi:hypothetical protein